MLINPQRTGGSTMDPKRKIVIVAQKSPQRITFCPKFKFGIFTIYLNRIWNLSSIISHLQAKLKRDLFSTKLGPHFPFINLMMCTCFYYIYHRIPKNTSIELKVGQSVCFRVSFEFTKYQVILGNFARFMGKKYYLQPQRTVGGGHPVTPEVFFGTRAWTALRCFLRQPCKFIIFYNFLDGKKYIFGTAGSHW